MSAGSPANLEATCREIALAAARGRLALRTLSARDRGQLLLEIAGNLRAASADILSANASDLARNDDLTDAMRDRLRLDESRLDAMARAIESIATQPDPVGEVLEGRRLASGIRLEKRRVPIGVVLIIYESRPNVTSDAAALCIKSGNAVILRGGKEAALTNGAIVRAIRGPLSRRPGLAEALQFVESPDRAAIDHLLKLEGIIDLAIPRGGPALMASVTRAARIPVIKHDAGNCHVYIDSQIEGMEDDAERIILNSKTQRPGVCNAAETLLIHRASASRVLTRLCDALRGAGVEVRGDAETLRFCPWASPASEQDWATEYLALIIAVRVVDSLEEACDHIRTYGSQHTEAIVTSSIASAERFTSLVDSASVMINCSTRFADGGEYGLGAEIGISTNRLHARGPMGAADLTTTQWVLLGSGNIR